MNTEKSCAIANAIVALENLKAVSQDEDDFYQNLITDLLLNELSQKN